MWWEPLSGPRSLKKLLLLLGGGLGGLLLGSDCCLQLGACGQLHTVTSGNLDGFTGLRIATGTSCTVGTLDSLPAGDGDLLALRDGGLESLEHCVEHCVHGCLALARLLCYLCNKFGTVLSHLGCPFLRLIFFRLSRAAFHEEK